MELANIPPTVVLTYADSPPSTDLPVCASKLNPTEVPGTSNVCICGTNILYCRFSVADIPDPPPSMSTADAVPVTDIA